jgi:hypothetical protein
VVDEIGNVDPEDIGHDENSIQVWFQALAFDPLIKKAQFAVFPWPSSDLATPFTSSTIIETDFNIFIDEMYGKGSYEFRDGDTSGAIVAEFDVISYYDQNLRDFEAAYPFDEYLLDTYVNVTRSNEDQVVSGRRAFEFFYENSVDGFQISYSRFAGGRFDGLPESSKAENIIELRNEGEISFLVKFQRNTAVKITLLLLVMLMTLNTLSLVWTTIGVARNRRPPSMQALVWSAASVLGIIQLRELFPGKPRLGVVLDYVVFFPTLILSMAVGLVLTVFWSRRADFHV